MYYNYDSVHAEYNVHVHVIVNITYCWNKSMKSNNESIALAYFITQ